MYVAVCVAAAGSSGTRNRNMLGSALQSPVDHSFKLNISHLKRVKYTPFILLNFALQDRDTGL